MALNNLQRLICHKPKLPTKLGRLSPGVVALERIQSMGEIELLEI